MKTETVDITKLKPNEANPRLHPVAQIEEMKRSVTKFGQIRPIVVDESNVILAGHGVYIAMMDLGMKKASVYRISGMTENDKKRLILADNKIADLGLYDQTKIFEMLDSLGDTFDVPGFNEDELTRMLRAIDDSIKDFGKGEPVAKNEEDFFSNENTEETRVNAGQRIKCPYCGREFSK